MSWHLDGISSEKSEGRRELRLEQRPFPRALWRGHPPSVSTGRFSLQAPAQLLQEEGRTAAARAALLEVFKMVLLAQVQPHRFDTAGALAGTNLPPHGVLHPEGLGSVLPQKSFWTNSEKHRI